MTSEMGKKNSDVGVGLSPPSVGVVPMVAVGEGKEDDDDSMLFLAE